MTPEPAIAPAIEYVQDTGTPFDRALLKVLLGAELSVDEFEALTEPQNPDGGFRVRELATPASVAGRTAELLTYLVAVGAEEFGTAQAAADFLIERQRPDGTWGEADELMAASPPPHFRPGSPDVIAWETAATLVALAGMGLPLDFRPPLEYLKSHRLRQRGGRSFRLEALLLYSAFRRLEGESSETARALEAEVQALTQRSLAVFELNWGIFAMRLGGAGPSTPLVRAFGELLVAQQRKDSSFGSGTDGSPLETVLALCALEQSGMAELPRAERRAPEEPDPADSARAL